MSGSVRNVATRSPLASGLSIVSARWPLVLFFILVGLGVSYLAYSSQSPRFESSARLQVSKRFDAANSDRGLFLEDYVTTITQLILSDAVLEEAANQLSARPLQFPLSGMTQEQVDLLRRMIRVTRERDPYLNGVGSSNSSVILLKCTSSDDQDAQQVLEILLNTINWYLLTRHDDAHTVHIAELDRKLSLAISNQVKLEATLAEQSQELLSITDEELTDVRARLAANHQRAFSLQLELATIQRELQNLSEIKASPRARAARRREILQTLRPDETRGSDAVLQQLLLTRLELSRKLLPNHPRLISLDEEIQKLQNISPDAPSEVMEDLAKRETQLQVRKSQLEVQHRLVELHAKTDSETISRGSKLQFQITLLQKQLDDELAEIRRLQERKTTLNLSKDSSRAYETRVIDRPRVGIRVAPLLRTYLVLGSFIGGTLGTLLAILLAFLSEKRKVLFENHFLLGIPVFGQVPPIELEAPPATTICSDGYHPSLVTALRPKSLEAEVYRGMRTRLLVAVSPANYRIIQVTSPNPGEGKSTTAANLAISLAQAGLRVLLIDADLRRPRQHTLFGLANSTMGLTSVLDGSSDLAEAVQNCAITNLFLLPAGPIVENPADMLAGAGFKAALSFLRERFDHVVIDTPPLFAVSDPLVVARCADAAILVTRPSRRGQPHVERAKEYLSENGVVVIGVVANDVKGATQAYYDSCAGIPASEDSGYMTKSGLQTFFKSLW